MKKKYINEWENTIKTALLALENKNFDLYNQIISKANMIVEDMKNEESLTYQCDNFGLINHIFEDALPQLFKHNKKIIKEFVNTIKSDKNLLNQFKFYKSLENYNNNGSPIEYINESLNLFYAEIDPKKINESNKKLSNIIEKYEIKPSSVISEEKQNFFKKCDFLFKNKKTLTNLSKINETINEVSEYVQQKKDTSDKSNYDFYNVIDEFDNKYNTLLNNNEKQIIREILSKDNPNEKEKIFNKIKNECITSLSQLVSDNDNSDIHNIKNKVSEMNFNSKTLINDIIKLLEIKSIMES